MLAGKAAASAAALEPCRNLLRLGYDTAISSSIGGFAKARKCKVWVLRVKLVSVVGHHGYSAGDIRLRALSLAELRSRNYPPRASRDFGKDVALPLTERLDRTIAPSAGA